MELAAAGDLGGYQKSGVGRPTQSLFPPRGPRPAESLPPSLGEGPPSLGEGPPSLGSGRRPCSCLTIASLCPPGPGLALRPSWPPLGLARGPVPALPCLLPDPLTLSLPSASSPCPHPHPASCLWQHHVCVAYMYLSPIISKMSFAACCPNQIPVQQQVPRKVTTFSILFDLRQLFFRTLPSSN